VTYRLSSALLGLAASICAQSIEFNRDVRAIFSDRCFACHGPDPAQRKSKLRLDREQDAKADIVPGSPEKSEVYKRISSENKSIRMPPAYAGHDRLPDKDIRTIRAWIEQGAVWQSHWSFIAPRRDAHATIDSIVHARLSQLGLKPSPEADRRALIRRVSLDLTGLPPSSDEVEKFVGDRAPDAYERVVDSLLASPRYAERMAIRWLEAARYADTNGYQSDGPRDMWRWRDWVIDAFNRDMPFDRFTIEQLAGDLLPNATLAQKIATGFQRNHRTSAEGGIVDEEFRTEYVADRAETTSTVWLGLTMGCSRCHDHKYDPITQKDFYSLFAFYNNVPEKGFVYNFGNEEPYIKAPLPYQQAKLDEFDRKIDALRRKVTPEINLSITDGLTFQSGPKSAYDGTKFTEAPDKDTAHFDYRDPFTFAAWIKPASADGAILSRAEDYFEGSGHGLYLIKGKLRLHVIFRWTDLGMRVETAAPLQTNERQHVLVTYDGSMHAAGVHMYVNGHQVPLKILFDQCIWPIDVKQPFRIGAGGGLRFKGEIEDVRVYKRALTAEEAAILATTKTGAEIAALSPADRTYGERLKLRMSRGPAGSEIVRAQLAALRTERKKLYDSVPTVMVMAERDTPRETHILKRGAYDAPAGVVTPGTPGFLPPLRPEWPRNRLGLARWLVDRSNPLTARVTVNRFWQMMFGIGLVKTVEDFGSQGELPLYQDLLDWLAVEFMDSGWDVKHTLKAIVMSGTYRQSSKISADLLQRDPENRLLARGPRIRLAPEMVRDQALAVAGLLVETVGGPSVKPYQPAGLWQELSGGKGYVQDKGAGLYRRTIYSYWKRTVAPPSMVNFDSPNRETCTVRETRTNTPLQALDLMNDVTYVEAARKLAERMIASSPDSKERISFAYHAVLARDPKPSEAGVLLDALSKFKAGFEAGQNSASEYLREGDSRPTVNVPPAELAAYAAVAGIVLNLDEAVTKQ
jgi:hypothetical protein